MVSVTLCKDQNIPLLNYFIFKGGHSLEFSFKESHANWLKESRLHKGSSVFLEEFHIERYLQTRSKKPTISHPWSNPVSV